MKIKKSANKRYNWAAKLLKNLSIQCWMRSLKRFPRNLAMPWQKERMREKREKGFDD